MGAGDQRRDPRGRVLLTACGQLSIPSFPPIPGADSFEGPRSTPPSGATTSTWRASAWPWWAPAAAPSRPCRRSSRSSGSSTSTSARPAGRSRRWTSPTRSAPSACSSASPSSQRLDRAALFYFMELGAVGMTRKRWLLAPFKASAASRSSRRSRIPSCAARSPRRDELGCKRLMLTDDWYPTLAKDNVELVDRPDRRGHAGGHPHRGRDRARGRRARVGDGLQGAWLRGADGDRRRRRPHASRRNGRRSRAPTWA